MLCIYYFILLFVIFNNKVYSVEVNAIAYSLNGGGTLYSPMISEFNTFSKNNNLNITINLNLISGLNSTSTVNGYEETLESLLNRKSDKYDLIFYDNIYTPRIEPYFLDLNKLIPKEHINIYIPGVITQIGFHNDRLVGFPITIDYTVLYCNEYYLNKYKKEIPKTWDELINTGKYILNEEKKLNNSDFIAYNGFFDYSEQGTCSLYEFIYSCRNSIDSEFPVLTDQITVKALKKLKEIKNEISSDEIFKSSSDFLFGKMNDKNFLFLKFWYLSDKGFRLSPLPGLKRGISGSTIGGHNLGINKYSNSNKRNEVIKVFMFLTSKELQKKYIINKGFYSPILSLYEEDDVCETVDCEFFKNIQLTARPTSKVSNYDQYSFKFRNYIYDFLYGNKTAEEALKTIYEITNFHYLTLKSDETNLGLIIFITTVTISIIMLSSIVFLFIKKYEHFFNFISNDLWIVIIIGFLVYLFPIFLDYGPIHLIKCYLNQYFNILGPFLMLLPLLIRLLINIPEKDNKILKLIEQKRIQIILYFIIIYTVIYGSLVISPYTIITRTFNDEKSIKICQMNNTFGNIIFFSLYTTRYIITAIILFLIFIEWNLRSTLYDIRSIVLILYISFLFDIFLYISNFIHYNDIILFLTLSEFIRIICTTTNYLLLYGIKLVYAVLHNEKKTLYGKNNNHKFYISNNTSMSNTNDENNDKIEKINILNADSKMPSISSLLKNKIYNYHYKTSVDSKFILENHRMNEKYSSDFSATFD